MTRAANLETVRLSTNLMLGLRPGDKVVVKNPDAILETLDNNGRLDNMPFMPEMLNACGKVFTVHARADKTCDTATRTGGRSITNTVHLEGERCDGSAHGGCQAACLNFWKEAWLERVPMDSGSVMTRHCSNDEIEAAKSKILNHAISPVSTESETVYLCQATLLPQFTEPLNPWDLRQYWRDLTTNRIGIVQMGRVFTKFLCQKVIGLGIGHRLLTSLYNSSQKVFGGHVWPYQASNASSTPTGTLDLAPGDYVRVKSFDEIMETVDRRGKNRGLFFDVEMVRYCGKIFRVHSRVENILDEATGKMLHFGNPCIILEDVWCKSEWSYCRRFCPRSIYHYWREIWLERVPDTSDSKTP